MAQAGSFDLNDDSVAVVIGSGAGGGTVASQLAQRGINVVCLEAGARLARTDIVNDEATMFPRITWMDERIGEEDAVKDFPLWTCKTVGGTTMHWTAACPRLSEHETRARSTYGNVAGTNMADWPIAYDELSAWYSRAEQLMGVAGTNGIPRMPENNNFKVLAAGARAIGMRDMDTNNMAINVTPRDGRAGCLQTGFCTTGCVVGAKWSTFHAELPKAELTGHLEIRPQSMATRILSDDSGKVTAVEYVDAAGQRRTQRAAFVCVAGNVVETARILLNSRSDQFPNGLANSSDQVGRNYMRHIYAGVIGVMPGKVGMYKGAQCAGIVKDDMRHDPSRGFVGGLQYHIVPFSPSTMINYGPTGWGSDVADMMERYDYMAGTLVLGEDLAESDNRITLHPTRRDQHGLPVPVVRYKLHPNTIAMREYGRKRVHEMYTALGAEQIIDMQNLPSTHNMGVARMGDDPATSVCNPYGQTHDIANLFVSDGSLFPSAGCANPTLTIVALALRQADYIASQRATGAL